MGHQRPHLDGERQSGKHGASTRGEPAERWPKENTPASPRKDGDRAGQNASDIEQGYSQDSGYPQSGGYERRPADKSASSSGNDDSAGTSASQIRIHASDELQAAPYEGARSDDDDDAARERRAVSDESIRATLHELLAGRASPRGVLVTVESGDVTIDGEVADPEERAELESIVRGASGVKSVRNRLLDRSSRH